MCRYWLLRSALNRVQNWSIGLRELNLIENGVKLSLNVLMLVSVSSLATMSKFQLNICFKMRAVGLIKKAWRYLVFDKSLRPFPADVLSLGGKCSY